MLNVVLSAEAAVWRCFVKKAFLKTLQNLEKNTCARASFLINCRAEEFKKETLAQVFSRGFCEIFKNTYFHRTPLVAASVGVPKFDLEKH